jgi:hypothetical protein
MIKQGSQLLDNLETLHSRKNPQIAALWGVLLGGIGLGIYFRSVIDALVPIGLFVVIFAIYGADVAFVASIVVAGIYGYVRAVHSNMRLDRIDSGPSSHASDHY